MGPKGKLDFLGTLIGDFLTDFSEKSNAKKTEGCKLDHRNRKKRGIEERGLIEGERREEFLGKTGLPPVKRVVDSRGLTMA